MKKNFWAAAIAAGLLGLTGGCADTPQPAAPATRDAAPDLYLRGEMNDYGVMEPYRLRSEAQGRCALATLRADWSPYKFKFADRDWTPGSNYGFAEPPGVMRPGSAPVRLNPRSRFEELQYHVSADGVYKFCLLSRPDGEYAAVYPTDSADLKPLAEVIGVRAD